ncbi:MAG: class I SAM-dependent rRNA methyltransferase, partial [Kiritimatiellaeota bacterium]|nr:class I SAM-dependent rRNA methyltransferase [Kiritimatiellota bacterium]
MKRVILHRERDFPLRHHHPWVLSGAVARVEGGEPEPGETVAVEGGDGAPPALGAWSGGSQIRVRVWTFDPAENVDAAFFARRVEAALVARRRLDTLAPGRAGRVVNAESDGLPGVTVDRYADFLVAQFTSAGAHRHKAEILDALRARVPCRGIYERSDSSSLAYEGLEPRCGVAWGEEPPALIEIREDNRRFWVDVRRGHKTGFYLDQRANRELVGRYAEGAEVLNAFAYTGGFGVAAALGGARHVTHVDLSADALALARQNVALNG